MTRRKTRATPAGVPRSRASMTRSKRLKMARIYRFFGEPDSMTRDLFWWMDFKLRMISNQRTKESAP